MLKKAFALVLALASAVSLAACGGSSSSVGHSLETKETFEPITLRFGNQHPEDSIAHAADLRICEKIAEVTDGRVKVDLYGNNALGDYTSVYEECMIGTIDMAHITAVETYDAKMSGAMLPYLGSNYEELKKAYDPDNYLFSVVSESADRQGLHTFGFFCEGFSGTLTNQPVQNANLSNANKDCLVRVPSLDNFTLAERRLGFQTSTIAYSDTYTAIQTNTVNGACGMPPNLVYQNFRDVTEYYYHYMMTQEATQILMSKKTWEKLLPEDQETISNIISEICAEAAVQAEEVCNEYMDMLTEMDISVVTFTDEELNAFSESSRANVWPQLAANYPDGWLDSLLTELEAA